MPDYKAFAPLSDFHWDGYSQEFMDGISIVQSSEIPNLDGFYERLSQREIDSLNSITHWLVIEGKDPHGISPSEIANIVLLALWLAKPTRTHITLRFEQQDRPEGSENKLSYYLDRFNFLSNTVHNSFDDTDLSMAAKLLEVMCGLCCSKGRLYDALVMTMCGCFPWHWQVRLICHSAALEALLTYSTKRGITRRICKAYACIVESDTKKRQDEYDNLGKLYNYRSDVMHGRTHNIREEERPKILERLEIALRRLWRTVLLSPCYTKELEGNDNARESLFNSLCAGWDPPKTKKQP